MCVFYVFFHWQIESQAFERSEIRGREAQGAASRKFFFRIRIQISSDFLLLHVAKLPIGSMVLVYMLT
jgi:hypothetical protein